MRNGDPAVSNHRGRRLGNSRGAHIEGSRVTVRDVHARVEKRGLAPDRVAERYTIDIADIYEALAYYHNDPEEMRRIEKRHERAAAEARERSSLTPPNS
ncbi:hypothetical protein BRC63_09920 [Halobacteriales archaeon QH_10_70_21]|nr:MAG: hypothetical protein BRC63_09920 [Halobacteriales archaeon QH_10_70_21]